jgi:phage FluMu gp28-like protein
MGMKLKNSSRLWTPEERLNYADAFIALNENSLNLDRWQELYIQHTGKFSISLKSRQTGFSFVAALKGLIKAMDPERFDYTIQFVSYNLEDAKEKIRYAKQFYHSIPDNHKKQLVSETKTSMEFLDIRGRTSSRLISISCRPPRGRHGDIVLDEMAIYPAGKVREIYTAAMGVITRGGCMEIGSTPLGKVGLFYDLFCDERRFGKYKRLMVPWWYSAALCTDVLGALHEAPNMETGERVKQFGKESVLMQFESMFLEDFQQEFECTFVDSAGSFITLDLIQANTPGVIDKREEVKVYREADDLVVGYEPEIHGERLYGGYDVARRRDAAVIFVLGITADGKKRVVAEIEMRNTAFERQMDEIRRIMRLPVVRVCIDQTGQGEPLCEQLKKEMGSSRIEGVLFTPENKEHLAIMVRTGLERGEFLLHNSRAFHRQIHSIKRIVGAGGRFRYDSERNAEGHADSFWAWALAVHAAARMVREGFYEQWGRRKVEQQTPARGKSVQELLRQIPGGRVV